MRTLKTIVGGLVLVAFFICATVIAQILEMMP